MSTEELYSVVGGTMSAAFISSIIRGISFILDLGRSVGTSFRRGIKGSICGL